VSDNDILYNQIGLGYNVTRQADPYITERLFQLLSPQPGKLYLDVGCGTGNYTIALSNKGFNFYGIEPSGKMLDIAKSRNGKINWLLAQAEEIPLNDNQFDGAIATLTIHHWTSIISAFREIYRVLKEEGKIVLFTAIPEQMKGYWLNHYFPKMLESSILQMPSFESIKQAAAETGFVITANEKYFVQEDLIDNFLYTGKTRPELYFEAGIREGISSFSLLANSEEVHQGLSKLRSDINLNKFEEVKKKYNNDLGDYLFIVLKKE
jgi:ubiquinone/menaquinone biosynthesis C-methylase UbiE